MRGTVAHTFWLLGQGVGVGAIKFDLTTGMWDPP